MAMAQLTLSQNALEMKTQNESILETNKLLNDLNSDGKITPYEKSQLQNEINNLSSLYENELIEVGNYGLSTIAEVSEMKEAYTALKKLLYDDPETSPLYDMNTTSVISLETIRNAFIDYYLSYDNVKTSINERINDMAIEAKNNADTALENANSALNNANSALNEVRTKIKIFTQQTEPTGYSFINGDVWYKLGTSDGSAELKIVNVYVYDSSTAKFVERKVDYNALSIGQLSAITSDLGFVKAGTVVFEGDVVRNEGGTNRTYKNVSQQSSGFLAIAAKDITDINGRVPTTPNNDKAIYLTERGISSTMTAFDYTNISYTSTASGKASFESPKRPSKDVSYIDLHDKFETVDFGMYQFGVRIFSGSQITLESDFLRYNGLSEFNGTADFNGYAYFNADAYFLNKLVAQNSASFVTQTSTGLDCMVLKNNAISVDGSSGLYNLYLQVGSSTGYIKATQTGSTTSYIPIKAKSFEDAKGNTAYMNGTGGGTLSNEGSLIAGGICTNSNAVYLGVSTSVCVTDTFGYNDGYGLTFMPLKASTLYANALDINTGTHVYVRPTSGGVVRVTATGSTSTFRPIQASSFDVSSSYTYKQDITEMTRTALDIVDELKVYEYRMKSDVEAGIYDLWKIGLIAEYSPQVSTDENMKIDTYKMQSLHWKATQELHEKTKGIEASLEIHLLEYEEKVKEFEEIKQQQSDLIGQLMQRIEALENK